MQIELEQFAALQLNLLKRKMFTNPVFHVGVSREKFADMLCKQIGAHFLKTSYLSF